MKRLDAIDALRSLAALMVVAFHYESLIYFRWPGEWPEADSVHLHLLLTGVELFFVISGFVILLTLNRNQDLWRFVLGRFGRIYPTYLLSVLVAGAFLRVVDATSFTKIIVNLTLLQSFFNVSDIVTPYWTLAYEIWFYAIIATIAGLDLLGRVDAIAVCWLVAAFASRLAGIDFGPVASILTMQQFGHLFIAGMMVFRIASGNRSPLTMTALLLSVLYSSFGRGDWAHISPFAYFLINFLFMLMVWVAATERVAYLPKWLLDIGDCSYSLYLWHVPVGMFFVRLADDFSVSRWCAIAVAFPTSIVIAKASRRFVEIPGQRIVFRLAAKFKDGGGPPRERHTV